MSVDPARQAALQALVRVERDGAFLNLALPPLLAGLPDRERALATRLAKGTVQRLNTVDWALSLHLRRPLDDLTVHIRHILRLGAYQLLYMASVPAPVAVNKAVKLAGRYGHRGTAGLVNAVLRRLAGRTGDLPWPEAADPVAYLSLKHSLPPWLVVRRLARFGFDEAEALCRADNEPAPISLRPNCLKTDAAELQRLLAAAEVPATASPVVPGALRLPPGKNPAALEPFNRGLFTVQGESSMLAAPLLAPRPGETVWDLCSAPGGKATHLAELMGDEGFVLAVDVHPRRLRLVEQAARRLGLRSVETFLGDGREAAAFGRPAPQAVLVDAPCSGLGVIRRLPELKWRRREEDPAAMREIQLDLLAAAARVLPAGGRLLYSVCTNEPEETDEVVRAFEQEHPDFLRQQAGARLPASLEDLRQETTVHLLPHRHGVDGFFLALWHKK